MRNCICANASVRHCKHETLKQEIAFGFCFSRSKMLFVFHSLSSSLAIREPSTSNSAFPDKKLRNPGCIQRYILGTHLRNGPFLPALTVAGISHQISTENFSPSRNVHEMHSLINGTCLSLFMATFREA